MSASAHTPGPWFVRDMHPTNATYNVGVSNPTDPLMVYVDEVAVIYRIKTGSESQHLANAQLIAAAPELLAALRTCLDFIKTASIAEGQWDWKPVEAADRAIAKAEGKSLLDSIATPLPPISLPIVGVINVDDPHDPQHKEWKR
jgi:hypothetical protein